MKLVKHNWTENVHIISKMVSFIFLFIELTRQKAVDFPSSDNVNKLALKDVL